jgi:hypothetical protein
MTIELESCEFPSESSYAVIDPERSSSLSTLQKITNDLFQYVAEKLACIGLGLFFGLATGVVGFCGLICYPISSSNISKECFFLSRLCASVAQAFFRQIPKKAVLPLRLPFQGVPEKRPSLASWESHRAHLMQLVNGSQEDQKLAVFLDRRWLAKSSGFIRFAVDWVYPLFGIFPQIHPDTSHAYARNTRNHQSKNYLACCEDWKKKLCHPASYPLVLTRPYDVKNLLPNAVVAENGQTIPQLLAQAAQLPKEGKKIILDLTALFPSSLTNPQEWLAEWERYQCEITSYCSDESRDRNNILCVVRLAPQGEVGALRMLPFKEDEEKVVEQQHTYLLDWIAHFGLAATRIELDRYPFPPIAPSKEREATFLVSPMTRERLIENLKDLQTTCLTGSEDKDFLIRATFSLLEGHLKEQEGVALLNNTTQRKLQEMYYFRIVEHFEKIKNSKNKISFFEIASEIEQIHACFSSLLEMTSPHIFGDFHQIYLDQLLLPEELKPLTSCALHTAGMTSLGGIMRCVEKQIGRSPQIIYGENTYYEVSEAVDWISSAQSIKQASDEELRQSDLIFAQFNPVVSIEQTESYRVENIEDMIHRALAGDRTEPLTVALDATVDYIQSPRTKRLLETFSREIREGRLQIICYRSGLKFDLLGMDNYAGAPLYMVHNQDRKWDAFESLLLDPIYQADELSRKWFSLAFSKIRKELDEYRKKIFDNTRAILDAIPQALYKGHNYWVMRTDPGADVFFIDLRARGPSHAIKGPALLAGQIFMSCMEAQYPIFFRLSMGFYHPNFFVIDGKEMTIVRLTVGIDSGQIDLFKKCFKAIATLEQ